MSLFSILRFPAALVLATSLGAVPSFAADDSPPALKAEAVGLVKEYAAQLKTTLRGALDTSGPLGALSVCHERAPAIAAEISERSGWTVGRTSLKPRNRASAPDAYERQVMEEFQARIAKGEKAADLVKAEIVDQNGRKVFRFIKAIPTAEPCLTCHGTDVKPAIRAKIAEFYPDDRATGFKLGDMRGVFTLSKGM